MSDETSTPTPDEEQPAADALAAAMATPSLRHPDDPHALAAHLAALLAQIEPGTTIH